MTLMIERWLDDTDERITKDDLIDAALEALNRIDEMVADTRRLEWLVENSAELILKDDYFGVGYGVNTVLTSKDNWRDAIDDAMKESE